MKAKTIPLPDPEPLYFLLAIEVGKAYSILLLLLGLTYLSVSFLWFYFQDSTQDEWGWTYPFFTKKGESIPCSSWTCRLNSFAHSLLHEPDGTPTPYTIFPYRRGNSLNPLTLKEEEEENANQVKLNHLMELSVKWLAELRTGTYL